MNEPNGALSELARGIEDEVRDTDPELQARFTELWEEVRAAGDWVEDATDTIRTALSFLRTAMDELDTSDPDAVRAVTKAIGTLAEAKIMADVVDERLSGTPEGSKEPTGIRLN